MLAAAPRTRLIVLEKARYPRDKICAGGVGARALRILEQLGVEVDVPRVTLDALALRVGSETLVVREPGLGIVVRRLQFDHAFADVARARGIEVRDGCEVESIAIGEAGVRLMTSTGAIEARAIVGADGVGGIARRALGFPRTTLRAQVIELDTPATAHDLPRDTIVFDFATRALHGYAWDFPTLVDGAELVCRGVYCLHDGRQAIDDTRARTADYLAARGLDVADYKLKRYAEQGLAPDTPIAAPRAILVGEAAGIDIATGEGIAQAIEYGALAGPYLAAALARDDLGFADWRTTIERRHLGKQFRIRLACYRALYGAHRASVERAIPQIASLVKVGIQDFAGLPIGKLALARGAAQFIAAMARDVISRLP